MKMKAFFALISVLVLILLAVLPAGGSPAAATEKTDSAQTAAEEEQAPYVEPDAPDGARGELTLWSADEEKDLCILIPERDPESARAAAELLAGHLSQVTGTTPRILSAGTNGDGWAYPADETAGAFIALSVAADGAKSGGYTVRAETENALSIEGNDARGLFNGVYAFLRDLCGVRLYSADVKTADRIDAIVAPSRYEEIYTPALEYADTDWISPHDADFAVANGLNGIYSPIPAQMGGAVKYITFAHSLTNVIVPADELLSTHPEYFALQENGERTGDQLCLSNPDTAERAIGDALRLIDEGYDETAPLNILSVTQDDNEKYCTCENCAALAERYGGQSGLMLWFVNKIADAVAVSEHPDVVVDTFAYQYTRHAPTGIVPRENVCIRLCSIECCFAHTLDDPACEENAAFMEDLRAWSAISDRLYIWDYTTNYSETLGLFPDFGVLQKNIQTFVQNSVVGIYEEGAYYAGECNTEFADLRAYLLTRFLRDPDEADPVGLRDGFLAAYYGEGAAEIGEFLDYMTAHAGDENSHLTIGQEMKDSLHGVSERDVKTLDALWDTAYEKAAAAGNADAAARIDRSRVSWEYYKACAGKGEYRGGIRILRRIRAIGALAEKLDALGVTRYSEWRTMADLKKTPLLSPSEWGQTSGVWYAICVCLTVAGLILSVPTAALCLKKQKASALLPVMAAILVPMGVYARELFRAWESIALYFALTAVMGLIVGAFALFAAWAMGGFVKMAAKKRALSYGIGSVIAIGIYHAIVFLVNNVALGGNEPAYAVCAALSWFAFLAAADETTVLIRRLRKKTEERTEKSENGPNA